MIDWIMQIRYNFLVVTQEHVQECINQKSVLE